MCHLPGDLDELKAMGRRLRFVTNTVEGKGDGLDRQAVGAVTRVWLKGHPTRPQVSMQSVFASARWGLFKLPRVQCPLCNGFIGSRRGCRKRSECDACHRDRVRRVDADRKEQRRHKDGVALEPSRGFRKGIVAAP